MKLLASGLRSVMSKTAILLRMPNVSSFRKVLIISTVATAVLIAVGIVYRIVGAHKRSYLTEEGILG